MLGRAALMKRGIAFLPRGRWRRSADSSRERNDSPGSAGRPRTGQSSAGDDDIQKSEVLVMRTAAAVLNIIQERGKQKLLLTPMYNWLILVFGEPLGKILPSSTPVISSSPFRRRVRAVVAGEQS